ncbi:MAG: acylphosphatase [Deltaproteobacteria bacterium]|nr:acylphosphatase [Deltaproteobacteria bacterium]
MSPGAKQRIRIIVTGRVQGVFFRRAAAEQARSLDITGWARNLNDGSVEIVGQGERRNLEALRAWAHKGPQHARVDEVQAEWAQCEGESGPFQVR